MQNAEIFEGNEELYEKFSNFIKLIEEIKEDVEDEIYDSTVQDAFNHFQTLLKKYNLDKEFTLSLFMDNEDLAVGRKSKSQLGEYLEKLLKLYKCMGGIRLSKYLLQYLFGDYIGKYIHSYLKEFIKDKQIKKKDILNIVIADIKDVDENIILNHLKGKAIENRYSAYSLRLDLGRYDIDYNNVSFNICIISKSVIDKELKGESENE